MRFLPLLLPALLLIFGGCHKTNNDEGPGFYLDYQERFTIPAGVGPFVVHHFTLKNVPTRFAQLLALQGKTDADVQRVLTTQGSLVAEYDEYSFDFVDKITVRLFDERQPNNFAEAAYRDPVPLDPGFSIGLIPSLSDSKFVVANDRMNIDILLELRTTTQDEIPVVFNLQLKALYE